MLGLTSNLLTSQGRNLSGTTVITPVPRAERQVRGKSLENISKNFESSLGFPIWKKTTRDRSDRSATKDSVEHLEMERKHQTP